MREIAESKSFKYYVDNHCEHEILTREQEQALSKRILAGDEDAVEELVMKNQQFVVHIAKKFLGFGLPIEDLIQEGNLGMITAARRYDSSKGFRFITYAVWWIRQALQRYTACEGGCVRLPAGTVQLYKVAKGVDDEHRRKFGTPAGKKHLAEALGSEAKARAAEVMLASDFSLNNPVTGPLGYDGGLEGIDLVESTEQSPEEYAMSRITKDRINDFLDSPHLAKRAKSVMRMVYGLDGNAPMNLQKIGDVEGCCRERVRQVREKTLKAMRSRKFLNSVLDADTAGMRIHINDGEK